MAGQEGAEMHPFGVKLRRVQVSRQEHAHKKPIPSCMSEIRSGLFLGNYQSLNYAEHVGITHIVHATKEAPSRVGTTGFHPSAFRHLKVPLADRQDQELLSYLPSCREFIGGALEGGGRVLVQCPTGTSRSAAVVIGYLMLTEAGGYQRLLSQLQAKWPMATPSPGFARQLKQLYQDQQQQQQQQQQRRRQQQQQQRVGPAGVAGPRSGSSGSSEGGRGLAVGAAGGAGAGAAAAAAAAAAIPGSPGARPQPRAAASATACSPRSPRVAIAAAKAPTGIPLAPSLPQQQQLQQQQQHVRPGGDVPLRLVGAPCSPRQRPHVTATIVVAPLKTGDATAFKAAAAAADRAITNPLSPLSPRPLPPPPPEELHVGVITAQGTVVAKEAVAAVAPSAAAASAKKAPSSAVAASEKVDVAEAEVAVTAMTTAQTAAAAANAETAAGQAEDILQAAAVERDAASATAAVSGAPPTVSAAEEVAEQAAGDKEPNQLQQKQQAVGGVPDAIDPAAGTAAGTVAGTAAAPAAVAATPIVEASGSSSGGGSADDASSASSPVGDGCSAVEGKPPLLTPRRHLRTLSAPLLFSAGDLGAALLTREERRAADPGRGVGLVVATGPLAIDDGDGSSGLFPGADAGAPLPLSAVAPRVRSASAACEPSSMGARRHSSGRGPAPPPQHSRDASCASSVGNLSVGSGAASLLDGGASLPPTPPPPTPFTAVAGGAGGGCSGAPGGTVSSARTPVQARVRRRSLIASWGDHADELLAGLDTLPTGGADLPSALHVRSSSATSGGTAGTAAPNEGGAGAGPAPGLAPAAGHRHCGSVGDDVTAEPGVVYVTERLFEYLESRGEDDYADYADSAVGKAAEAKEGVGERPQGGVGI